MDLREYEKAQGRIGRTAAKSFHWLLEFAQRGMSNMSEGDWLNARYEVLVMTNSAPMVAFGQDHPELADVPQWTDWGESAPLPTVDKVSAIQTETHRLLQTFLDHNRLRVSVPSFHVQVERYPEPGRKDALLSVDPGQGEEAAWGGWRVLIVSLLKNYGGALRRCPECGKFFHARRRTQAFDTRTCVNRATQRRWRERQRESEKTRPQAERAKMSQKMSGKVRGERASAPARRRRPVALKAGR